MTKSEITKKLNEYKKAGWLVYTWNDRRAVPSGAKGWVDHVLIHPKWAVMFMMEIKLGKDKMSRGQSELHSAMINNHMWVINHCKDVDEKRFTEILKSLNRITERGKE